MGELQNAYLAEFLALIETDRAYAFAECERQSRLSRWQTMSLARIACLSDAVTERMCEAHSDTDEFQEMVEQAREACLKLMPPPNQTAVANVARVMLKAGILDELMPWLGYFGHVPSRRYARD